MVKPGSQGQGLQGYSFSLLRAGNFRSKKNKKQKRKNPLCPDRIDNLEERVSRLEKSPPSRHMTSTGSTIDMEDVQKKLEEMRDEMENKSKKLTNIIVTGIAEEDPSPSPENNIAELEEPSSLPSPPPPPPPRVKVWSAHKFKGHPTTRPGEGTRDQPQRSSRMSAPWETTPTRKWNTQQCTTQTPSSSPSVSHWTGENKCHAATAGSRQIRELHESLPERRPHPTGTIAPPDTCPSVPTTEKGSSEVRDSARQTPWR